jgi:hypothetical protein
VRDLCLAFINKSHKLKISSCCGELREFRHYLDEKVHRRSELSKNVRRVVMQSHSKIEVWYKVSGDRIFLGETSSSSKMDVISLWVGVHFDVNASENEGYELTLIDDGGCHIGKKQVSQADAESILGKGQELDLLQHINISTYSNPQYGLATVF